MIRLHIKKSKLILLILLIVIVVIILLFILLGQGITCSDWLVFTGTLIGGIASFTAIYLSYSQNEKYHQRAIMPFIVLEPIEIVNIQKYIFGSKEPTYKLLLNDFNKIIRIDGGDLNPVTKRDILSNNSNEITDNLSSNMYYYRKLTIQNIGTESAYNINIKIQNQEGYTGLILAKNEKYSTLLEIHNTHGGNESNNYKIDFIIEFCDLAGRKYIQHSVCEVNYKYLVTQSPKNNPPELL